MNTASLEYIPDEKGNIKSVIVPIEIWRNIEGEQETAYLMKSEAMKKRILEAMERDNGFSLEEINEKLGI